MVFDETTGIDAQNGGALVHLDGGNAFNPQAIPHAKVDGVCKPVYPHDYVKTNTVFEVVKARVPQARTAWADVSKGRVTGGTADLALRGEDGVAPLFPVAGTRVMAWPAPH